MLLLSVSGDPGVAEVHAWSVSSLKGDVESAAAGGIETESELGG